MAFSNEIFLGFDPGGIDGFGAALLVGKEVATATVPSVAAAVEWAVMQCGASLPVGAGVDTLLHWSDGPKGWRPADLGLKSMYPSTEKSVVAPNSLYGAMAVGGMALALRLRERWPAILLNETHPKVLVPALGGARYKDISPEAAMEWFASHAGLDLSRIRANGHELDALLSAWATQQGVATGWPDLVGEDPALLFPAGRASYFWPTVINAGQKVEPRDQPPSERAAGGVQRPTGRNTTAIGRINKFQQEVVRKTDLSGTDHGQRVYVLRCRSCGHEYGVNGSTIWSKRCPRHDRGAPGLAY